MVGRRWRAPLAPVLIWLGCTAAAQAQLDPADRAALDKAGAAMQWVNNYTCPSLGLPPNVKGMQTDAEIAAQQESSWAFAQGRQEAVRGTLTQRDAVLRQAKRNDNYEAELSRLDALVQVTLARAGTALVNWSLANWVEMARLDAAYPYPSAGPHPLERFVQREARLRDYLRGVERQPGAAEYVAPVVGKFRRCLLIAQNQVVERNADSIRAAMNAVTRSADVAAIGRGYGIVDTSFAGPDVAVPQVIEALRAHADTLRERERIAAEAEAKRLAELARLEELKRGGGKAVAGQRPGAREPPPNLQAQLRTAKALVQALVNRSVSDSLQHMHNDVSLSSQLGYAQGKSQVSSSLQQGFASGRGGSIGQPYISGSQIVADVQSPRGSATMYFGFAENLVVSLSIR